MCTHCLLRLQAVLHTTSAASACYVLTLIWQQMHDSECLSLPYTICVYCNSSPCMLAGSAAGTDNSGSGASESGPRSAVPQGAGPRIYVGGIPNAVSETMVRKYFSNWGKVRPLTGSKQFSQYRSFQFNPVLCSLPWQCLVSQMRCILGISSCMTQHPIRQYAVDVTRASLSAKYAMLRCHL